MKCSDSTRDTVLVVTDTDIALETFQWPLGTYKKWDLRIIYWAGFWNYHFWDYITSSILGVLLLWIVLSRQSIFSSHTLCSRFSLKFSPPVECCLTTLGELSHSYKPCSMCWLTCKSYQLYSTKYILHCHLVLFDFHHLYLVSRSIRNSKRATS